MKQAFARQASLILLFVVVISGYVLVWTFGKPAIFATTKADFSCFYRAGRMVTAGDGARVYDLDAERRYDAKLDTAFVDPHGRRFSLPFVFAPYVLLLFAPLSLLPYAEAEAVWYGINVALLLALPLLLRKSTANAKVALVAPLLFVPVLLVLMQGQPTILLLAIFAAVFASLRSGDDGFAGCLLALASFKPQLALPLLLALAAMRRWKALLGFALAGIALLAASAEIVGWKATLHYPVALAEFSSMNPDLGGEHVADMPNLRGLMANVCAGVAGQRITLLLSTLLLLGMGLLLCRRRQMTAGDYSLVLAVTLLVSYHAYLHDFSLLLLPCVLLMGSVGQARGALIRAALLAVLLALYLIPLAPTSLHATAVQMCVAVTVLAIIVARLSCHRHGAEYRQSRGTCV